MEGNQRPDGSTASAVGWLLIVAGGLAALFTAGAETTEGWIFGIALANLGLGLGVLLLSLGYLVRAIWFLPGREVELAAAPPSDGGASGKKVCGWCERELPASATTCTSLTMPQLQRVAPKITDPVCRSQLQSRGITGESQHG
jgi:hypothetical protein